MGEFSFGEALSAGFRLIGRKPLALLFWAAAYLLLLALPAVLVLVYFLPTVTAAVQDAAQHVGPPDPARMMALRSRMFGWQPTIWLLQVAAQTILMGAVFRGVLEPDNSRWGYLRVGRQELWLGLTYLVIAVMSIIMAVVLFLPLAIGAGLVAAAAEHGARTSPTGVALLCLAAFAAMGVMIWVLLRLSLALPMSFAQARFMLYESWDLTRGQAFKMFLVFLVLVLGLVLLELIVVATVGVSLIPRLKHAAPMAALLQDAKIDIIRRWGPTILGVLVVVSVVATAIRAIFVAPLAEIYRQLTASAPPAA